MIRYLLLTAPSDLLGTAKMGVDYYRNVAATRFARSRDLISKEAN